MDVLKAIYFILHIVCRAIDILHKLNKTSEDAQEFPQ